MTRSQQSIFYFPDMIEQDDKVDSRPQYYAQLYTRMLIEDVSISLIPVGSRAREPFRVFVTPPKSKTEELIAAAITQRDYIRDLADATYDFFSKCSYTIMAYGEAIYEIVYLSKPGNGMVVGFELTPIQPLTVERRLGKLVQYVPKEVAHARKVSQYIRLSPERILTFKLPTYIQKQFNHVMQSLAFLSSNFLPDFTLSEVVSASNKVAYDMRAHLRSQKLALADAGKIIGWNARGLLQEEMVEYYFVYRQLLFERFKIELRTSILETLNEGLERAGGVIGCSGRLVIEGLPSVDDVETAQAHLASGERSFKEILEPFLRY